MDIQTVTVVLAGISVIIGVINSIRSNRRADEQRQMELISQIYERIQDRDFTEDWAEIIFQWEFTDYEEYQPKYSIATGQLDAFVKFSRVSRFLNHVCELIDTGIIDMKFVSEQLAQMVIRFYEKFEPVIKGARIAFNNPIMYDEIESVYPRLRAQIQQKIDSLPS